MIELLTKSEVGAFANFCTIVGFIITIFTFIITSNVRKQIMFKSDKDKFRARKIDEIARIEAYINTLKDSKIEDTRIISAIYFDTNELSNKYLFFRRKTKKEIKSVLNSTNPNALVNYNQIVVNLIKLKSQLEREG